MPSLVAAMDDTSGAAPSMFGVASAGLRLSLLLNAVSCQVANIGVEIHTISKGISAFAYTLKQVAQATQDPGNVTKPEAIDRALQITESARMVFDEIEAMLDKVQKTGAQGDQAAESIVNRFRICFKRQRVTYLLAELEFLRLGLAVLLQTVHLGKMLILKSSPHPPTDELIAHERAETQNMIIVRYWAQKRLDRLWDLSRQEALEGDIPDTEQVEITNLGSPPPTGHLDSPSFTEPYKYPMIRLGVDTSLNAIEDSPKDMLRITDTFLEEILTRWINGVNEGGQRALPALGQKQASTVPRVHVSSSSEEEDGYSSDGLWNRPSPALLEGPTTDWRKPHSQEARQQAARLRNEYSNYQASVESDLEDHPHPAQKEMLSKMQTIEPISNGSGRTRVRGYSNLSSSGQRDGQLDTSSPVREHEPRPYAYSVSGGRPSVGESSSPMQDRQYSEPQSRPPIRVRSQSQSQSQPTLQPPLQAQYQPPVQPPPASQTQPYTPSAPRPIVPPPHYKGRHNQNTGQGRTHSSSFTATPQYNSSGFANGYPVGQSQSTPSSYTAGAFTQPPARTQPLPIPGQIPQRPSDNSAPLASERLRSRAKKNREPSLVRESSKERRERFNRYRKTATKGILSVGAIATFMEALEAFEM